MRLVPVSALMAVLCLCLTACGSSSGATATQKSSGIGTEGTTVKKDAGGGSEADVASKSGAVGDACEGDAQCTSAACVSGFCAAACKATADCGAGEDCTSDNGKRVFCHKRSYAEGTGTTCEITGACPTGLKCIGNKEVPGAVCSATCASDLDCPPTLTCRAQADGNSYCTTRKFCTGCAFDEQCGPGAVCADMGKGKFCSKLCNAGSTECPRYADCTDVGGLPTCVHRAGTCAGDGSVCQPCSDAACNEGQCLTFPGTLENFCSKDCTTNADCGTLECSQVSADTTKPHECTPKTNSCVSKITPTMGVGDIMDDFGMIGYVDTNDNISLADETPKLIHLSDFSDRKLIAVTISAGWCGPCQEETTTFETTMKGANYEVMIFQILVEGPTHGSTPTLAFSKDWVTQLKAAGASGIDATGIAQTWNEAGSIPMNMVIDAKTRQILKKFNGSPPGGWTPTLKYYLDKMK